MALDLSESGNPRTIPCSASACGMLARKGDFGNNLRFRRAQSHVRRRFAQVVKLVDAGDSKSPAARRAGSIPALGTIKHRSIAAAPSMLTTLQHRPTTDMLRFVDHCHRAPADPISTGLFHLLRRVRLRRRGQAVPRGAPLHPIKVMTHIKRRAPARLRPELVSLRKKSPACPPKVSPYANI